MPPAASWVKRSPSAFDSASSSPEPGSSRSRSLGPMARARASSTIRARPVDMFETAHGPDRPVRRPRAAGRTWPWPAIRVLGTVPVPDPAPPSSWPTDRRVHGMDRRRCRHSHHLTVDSSPTCTFSPADRVPNSSRRWNVRASPSRARRWGLTEVTSVSNRWTAPRSGTCRPLITLNSVVFPPRWVRSARSPCPAPRSG